MKRILPALALLSLTGCSYLGLTSKEEKMAAPPAEAVAAAPQAVAISEPKLAVADGWALVTPKGAKLGAGFLTVTNAGSAGDRLIAASSPRAKSIEIHEMMTEGTKMKMRPADGLDVPPSGSVALNDKGPHLMFNGIDKPFKDGETIPVKLKFEKSGEVETTLTVKKAAN